MFKKRNKWVKVKSPSGRISWVPERDLYSSWGEFMGFKKI